MAKKDEPQLIQSMDKYPEITFIPSGVPEIDKLTGGFPRGRITELYGKKSVGKTTLSMYMLKAISQDYKILFIDAENALNIERLKSIGGDLSNIDFSTTSVLEEIGQLMLDNLNNYDAIILDSIAGTITRTEAASEVGDHNVGNKGKVMNSIFSRRLPELAAKSNCALVLINQLRDSFSMYGEPTYTPGGKAVEYAASLRIYLNTVKADLITKDGKTVGHWVQCQITKSKISPPYMKCRFKIMY